MTSLANALIFFEMVSGKMNGSINNKTSIETMLIPDIFSTLTRNFFVNGFISLNNNGSKATVLI
ncbi:MAG: hypothetical protein QM768_08000 [Agriterribacter sp.]